MQFAEVDENKEEEGENPLLVPLEEKAVLQEEQANLWFSKVEPGRLGCWHSLGEELLKFSYHRMASVEWRMMLMRPWRSVRHNCYTRAVRRSHPHHLLVSRPRRNLSSARRSLRRQRLSLTLKGRKKPTAQIVTAAAVRMKKGNFIGWFLNHHGRGVGGGGVRIIVILPPFSWKGSRGIKRSRGSKEDDGFEVVPIEDPGKKYVHSGEKSQSKFQ